MITRRQLQCRARCAARRKLRWNDWFAERSGVARARACTAQGECQIMSALPEVQRYLHSRWVGAPINYEPAEADGGDKAAPPAHTAAREAPPKAAVAPAHTRLSMRRTVRHPPDHAGGAALATTTSAQAAAPSPPPSPPPPSPPKQESSLQQGLAGSLRRVREVAAPFAPAPRANASPPELEPSASTSSAETMRRMADARRPGPKAAAAARSREHGAAARRPLIERGRGRSVPRRRHAPKNGTKPPSRRAPSRPPRPPDDSSL